MPIGELGDLIAGYQIMNGISKKAEKEIYLPRLE